MALSREMEFHADEIAASITGFEPLRNALLRMPMASNCFQFVLNTYGEKIGENIIAKNVFSDQLAMLHQISKRRQYPMENGLPLITFSQFNKYNKSKLVIKDQWASHPSVEERVSRLEATGYSAHTTSTDLANVLFTNLKEIEEAMTRRMFEQVTYTETPVIWSTNEILQHYQTQVERNELPGIFNEYYDDHVPLYLPATDFKSIPSGHTLEQLFSNDKVDLIYTLLSLKGDIDTLYQIYEDSGAIKSFDYDGVKYRKKSALTLAEKLQRELSVLQSEVVENDANIYAYFLNLEKQQKGPALLENQYRFFYQFNELYQKNMDIHSSLSKGLYFVDHETPFKTIAANLRNLIPHETQFKIAIKEMMATKFFEKELTPEMFVNFTNYTTQNLSYFDGANYHEDNLTILYTSLNDFDTLFANKYYELKQTMLVYMESLVQRV
jgi:hypothetical protein